VLRARDRVSAARIEPHNRRRIVRALEVIELTGQPYSAAGVGLGHHGETVFPVRVLGVWLPPAVLDVRIGARVDAMYDGGLLDEARALGAPGAPPLSHTAAHAIGYREAFALLDGSEPSVATARAVTAQRTRQLARRQIRWFRRDPRITWWGTSANPVTLAPALLECCRG
jgi:tRNA dimethylallyltransferase